MSTIYHTNEQQTYKIIGAAMTVHRVLGCGFLEAVYKEALEIELQLSGIQFHREKKLDVRYKKYLLNKHYYADFICYDSIILEIKACDTLASLHISQVLNYLKATGFELGLLFNFGAKSLEHKRIIL